MSDDEQQRPLRAHHLSGAEAQPTLETGYGELPVTLQDGVLRVGSSYALAGVASFWTPFAPVAEARCVWRCLRRARADASPAATAASSLALACSAVRRPTTACAWRRHCAANAFWPARA